MTTGPYRRVPAEEGGTSASGGGGGIPRPSGSAAAGRTTTPPSPATEQVASMRTAAERVSDKIHALAWMGAAAAVAKYADVFGTMRHDPRVLRPVFHAALVLLGINTVLTLYLAVYLPRVVGIRDCTAWEAYCPRVIPTITALGILCGFLLIRSLWPVWGVLTPLVLGVESLGALFSLHFIPWL